MAMGVVAAFGAMENATSQTNAADDGAHGARQPCETDARRLRRTWCRLRASGTAISGLMAIGYVAPP